ncbi:hypothetical protein BJV78DRAFT_790186 [Lactifluus subvellereus]|nr:hypothetical protein BJV78DRAFT_790186 [Lactifluus subvellereus]
MSRVSLGGVLINSCFSSAADRHGGRSRPLSRIVISPLSSLRTQHASDPGRSFYKFVSDYQVSWYLESVAERQPTRTTARGNKFMRDEMR